MSDLPLWQAALRHAKTAGKNGKAVLKIILKTKDDPYLLQDFIDHHAAIVGLENLVILDNHSSDPEVLKIYEQYKSIFPIGCFGGFHNNPHNKDIFLELYEWLVQESQFYVHLDTDERLIWTEGESYFADARILQELGARGNMMALPGTWLNNAQGSRVCFRYGTEGGLIDNMRWGKPIISTKADRPKFVLHNREAVPLFEHTATNFLVLHLSQLSVRQRINSNLNKLRSYGILPANGSINDVHAVDVSTVAHEGLARILEEVKKLAQIGSYPVKEYRPTPDLVTIEDGKIEFFDEKQKNLFSEFHRDPARFISKW